MADSNSRGFDLGGRAADGSPRSAGFLTGAIAVMAIISAAGAGYLLVSGADTLRGQGERTLAASNSGGFLELRSAYGEVADGNVESVHELVGLPNAVVEVDLRNVTITLSGPGGQAAFSYSSAGGDGGYTAQVVRDTDASFGPETPIVTQGDLIELTFPAAAAGLSLGPGDEIRHVQQVGKETSDNIWKVPLNLGSGTIVHLAQVE